MKPLSSMHSTITGSRGFSLIELMVAITVALILLAGVLQLFTSNRQAFRIQEGFNLLNENARFAVSQLQYDLRMAQHWRGAAALNTGGAPSVSGTGNCANVAISDLGLEGVQGGAYNTLPGNIRDCIPQSDYVLNPATPNMNSDIIIVRYLNESRSYATNPDPLCLPSSVPVRAEVGFDAAFVSATCEDPDTGISVRPYYFALYYVRRCSNTDIACDSPDADDTPGLAKIIIDAESGTPTMTTEIVVEGVEQMKIIYGLDLNGNRNADIFRTADVMANNDWPRVISARIDLLIRTTVLDFARDFGDANNTFRLLNDTAAEFSHTVAPGMNRRFHRKVFSNIVQVRNHTRS